MEDHNNLISICVLAYKRPEKLMLCLSSILKKTKGVTFELIVNLDGDNLDENRDFLFNMFKENKLSKLIFVSGGNRGVGRSFANCVGVSEGNYIVKVDSDIEIINDQWALHAKELLDNNQKVGAISFFDYRNYDPNDQRFEHIQPIYLNEVKFFKVNDFVSSIYMFRRDALAFENYEEDDGFHQRIALFGQDLVITSTDYIRNTGFGVTNSTYVSGTEDHPFKTPTVDKPYIFKDL